MGDPFDIQLRKIEIAWAIADEATKRGDGRTAKRSSQQYMEAVAKHLQEAWDLVNQTFPTRPGDLPTMPGM